MGAVYTFRQFSEKHPAFSEASLRWMRFNAPGNGYGSAFIKEGSRVLVDEAEFFKVLKSHTVGGVGHAA